MRRLFVCLLTLFLTFSYSLSEAGEWRLAKSNHFIVYYKEASESFINRTIEKAEEYYDQIADELGFRRYDFWLWDKRAKIYIYDNLEDYQAATDQPSWSSGIVSPKDKIIKTFLDAHGFFDRTLPHEMGHIIFREFVGFDNHAIPVWLDEGVASLGERQRYSTFHILVKQAIKNGKFIQMEELTNLSPQQMQDDASVNLFYAESISIVDYLLKEFGRDRFVFFCQTLRDKRDLKGALSYAYSFRDTEDLGLSWREYLDNG
ncbi:hypothetical protein D4R78_00145 [bacterium]|nr:MAG: hypothetical protein D4R78_00145 [bacterium]